MISSLIFTLFSYLTTKELYPSRSHLNSQLQVVTSIDLLFSYDFLEISCSKNFYIFLIKVFHNFTHIMHLTILTPYPRLSPYYLCLPIPPPYKCLSHSHWLVLFCDPLSSIRTSCVNVGLELSACCSLHNGDTMEDNNCHRIYQ